MSQAQNDDAVVVYWAVHTREYDWPLRRLIQQPPTFLYKDDIDMNVRNSRSQMLLGCPAHQQLKSNTIIMPFPFAANFEFGETNSITGSPKNLHFVRIGNPDFDQRHGHVNNNNVDRLSISFELQKVFFCEESLEMQLTPPYSHQTVASSYGAQVTGQYDIGQWFRPITIEYLLWKGVRTFKCAEDEPALYAKFNTEKKIILKEFRPNHMIFSIACACEDLTRMYKNYMSLDWRYERFTESPLRRYLLNEIKNNLV